MLARIEANERRQIVDQAKNDANQARNEERFEKIFDFTRLDSSEIPRIVARMPLALQRSMKL